MVLSTGRWRSVVWGAAILSFAAGLGKVCPSAPSLHAADRSRPQRLATDETFHAVVLPLVQQYCIDCHGEDDPEGDVSLADLSAPAQILENRKVWEKAFRQLGIGGMPPTDEEQRPSRAEQTALVDWLDLKLFHCDCNAVDDVGRETIHRLNRVEYNNTIRDLVGVDLRPADDFPSDDVGYGFSNIGDVLSLPPLLFEKYMAAAEEIAAAAIVAEPGTNSPESHRRIVVTRPGPEKSAGQAAREILGRFLPRAFRRPVSDGEIDRFAELVPFALQQGDSFERGVQVAVAAVLVSPHFLFRVETDALPNDSALQHSVTDFELASRLSYFLWSTMPDDELFRLAQQGTLAEPEVLDAQIARMLGDPKADALVDNFVAQWLNLGELAEVAPDRTLFPEFTPELRADMLRETKLLARSIFREDRSLLDFLNADYTFLNERLAKHYGIDGVEGDTMRRVSLAGTPRAGVLGHASVLTLTSNPNRTSLVRRGNWIVNNVLGLQLPDPPASIPSLEEGAKKSGASTLRAQLALHRANPGCASCHNTLDPLGFGLENFDAIGRWREESEGKPVESGGVMPSGESFRGPRELIAILTGRQRKFAELLTRKTLTYALGRGLEIADSCTVDDIVAELDENDYRWTVLVRGIVHSRPFRMRRGEAGVQP